MRIEGTMQEGIKVKAISYMKRVFNRREGEMLHGEGFKVSRS